MSIIITLFYISLATIIFMIVRKLVVLRNLKLSLVEGVEKEIHGKFYETAHHAWHVFKEKVLFKIKTILLAIFFTIAHEVLHYVGVLGAKLKERHAKYFDMVEGKGVLRKKGSVSFFLRDIAEHKKSLHSK